MGGIVDGLHLRHRRHRDYTFAEAIGRCRLHHRQVRPFDGICRVGWDDISLDISRNNVPSRPRSAPWSTPASSKPRSLPSSSAPAALPASSSSVAPTRAATSVATPVVDIVPNCELQGLLLGELKQDARRQH